MDKTPTLSDLECLITWPPGSVGELRDTELLRQLLSMCRQHGFGRVPQLAAQIEAIWRDPDIVVEYQAGKERHMRFMRECQEASR